MQKGVKLDAEAVEESIRRIHLVYPGKVLDQADQELFRTVLGLQLSMITDLRLRDPQAEWRWFSFLQEGTIDILRFARSMKFLAQFVIDYLDVSIRNLDDGSYWSRLSLPGFKRLVARQSLYWGCMAPVVGELEEMFTSGPTTKTVGIVRQWACFSSRLNFRSLDLEAECEAEYVAAEQAMRRQVYNCHLIESLNEIVREWFTGYKPVYTASRHGPGSVSQTHGGRLHRSVKNSIMKTDFRLEYLLARREWYSIPLEAGLSRISELVCVPKSMEKNRTISREPAVLQYFQQGLFASMRDWVEHHDWLRHVIQLDQQEKSKRLAQLGSSFGQFATIDLSNASDSVTLTLVKGIFRKSSLYADLICVRSDATVLPSGRILELEKYAPMGSAVCFPVECIVFSAICELAAREVLGPQRGTRPEYRVYGDDIVADTKIAHRIVSLLAEMHFQVNESKSYWDVLPHNFREACGGEYLDGVEITPLRISRWFHFDQGATLSSVEAVTSFVELCNNFYRRGYMTCRRYLMGIGSARFNRWNQLYYIDKEDPSDSKDRSSALSPSILTFPDCRTNYRLRRRWNSALYRTEYLALVSEAVDDTDSFSRDCRRLAVSKDTAELGRYQSYWQDRLLHPIYRTEYGVVITPEAGSSYPVRLRWRTKWVAE